MEHNRLYVDLHILQTLPPSCVNRDDTGSPKTAVYGGVTRARISSQSWKRAMRVMFEELLPEEKLGKRTKRIVGMVAEEIRTAGSGIDPEDAAQKVLEAAGLKIKSAEKGTDALFFLSRAQAKALAELAVECPEIIEGKATKESKTKAQNALKLYPGIDIALFGRMVADDPSLNTDACAQVAHSISTHKVSTEYDYFTAVDDLSPKDNAGAGHIGTVEYNSSTLYRYATVAVHELHRQLREDTVDAVCAFVRAFVFSMPTGKQNTFANRTVPDAILLALRKDQPINLVGAFEKPVQTSGGGFVDASAKALAGHAEQVSRDFAGAPEIMLVSGRYLSELAAPQPFNELLDTLSGELSRRLESGEGIQ